MNHYRTNLLWIGASLMLSVCIGVPMARALVQEQCLKVRLLRTLSLSFGNADRPARDAVCSGETRSTQLLKRGGSIRVNETAD